MENWGWFVFYNNIYFFAKKQQQQNKQPALRDISMVYLSNRPHFLWVYRRDNPLGMLGEHSKSL